MLVSSIPCVSLVVFVEGESMLCFLLIIFIVYTQIDALVSEFASGISVTTNNLSYTPPITLPPLYIILLPTRLSTFGVCFEIRGHPPLLDLQPHGSLSFLERMGKG